MKNAYNLNIVLQDLCEYTDNSNNISINYESLKRFISKKINISDVAKVSFPIKKKNIFISHSHKDESLATKLANYFDLEFGLSSFVDSKYWHYKDNVFNELYNNIMIDDDIVYTKLYDSVNMEFCNAILQVMNESDIVIFINSKNMSYYDEQYGKITNSPWIFYENEIAKIFKKNDVISHSDELFENFEVVYEFNNSFANLKYMDLKRWIEEAIDLRKNEIIDMIANWEFNRY